MTKTRHKRNAVASIFQNGISLNTICAKRDGFRRKGHILSLQIIYSVVQYVLFVGSALYPHVLCVASHAFYLYYCQPSMTFKLVLYCMHVCLHYCQCSVPCIWILCCVCATASAVCCVCKSCAMFVLLPVQCAVHVSAVLCLHYCQCSVLCV